MAWTFPLSESTFVGALPIQSMTFDLPEAVEVSETGGGEILTADLGTRLWQGEVTLGKMTPDEAADALAIIDVARRAGGSIMAWDKSRPGPRADLAGGVLGAAAVKLAAVTVAAREVKLSGLPAGYLLQRYDYLAFSYGSNPVRYALHRCVRSRAADGSGNLDWTEVVPNIRPGWAVNAPVTLLQAACKAIIVPGSVQPGRRTQTMTEGVSFKWRQTLR